MPKAPFLLFLTILLLITPTLALSVTLKADFTNDAYEERAGTLSWFLQSTNGGSVTNVTKYCLQGTDSSKITVPAKDKATGKAGTAHKECTVNDESVLTEVSYLTYAELTYKKGDAYYTFQTEKSSQFSFGNIAGSLIGGLNNAIANLFGKITCDKNPQLCDKFEGDNFCFLSDSRYKSLTADAMINELAKTKDSKLISIPSDYESRIRAGCLPKNLDGYFDTLNMQSADCGVFDKKEYCLAQSGCEWVSEGGIFGFMATEKCSSWDGKPLKVQSAGNEGSINNATRIYDTGAYVTYDKAADKYHVLIYSHVKGANSNSCTMSFALGSQVLPQDKVSPGFVSDLVYESKIFSISEPEGNVTFKAILTCGGVQVSNSSGFVDNRFFTDAKGSKLDEILTIKSESSECGPACDGGLTVSCTRERCYGLGKCVYQYGANVLGMEDGTCKSCTNAGSEINACGDYGSDEENCQSDLCGIGSCSFDGEKCLSTTPKKPFKVIIVPIIGDKDYVFKTDLGNGDYYLEGYRIPQTPVEISDDEINYAVDLMPCKLNLKIVRLDAKYISSASVNSIGEVDTIVHTYVHDSNPGEYSMVLVILGDTIQRMYPKTNEVRNLLGASLGGDTYYFPGGVNGGDLLHEMGHLFGNLCDEGYNIFKIDEASCKSGYATGMFKGFSGCGRTDYYDCCPNAPETDSNSQGSIMCSSDSCGTGCIHGYYFSKTSAEALKAELEKNGYCN